MELQIGKATIAPEKTGYRPMGFGERVADRPTHDYELRLSLSELAHLIKPAFDDFVAGNQEDDAKTNSEDAVPELVAHNYAKFDDMIRDASDVVADLITKYLDLEFLEAAFGRSNPAECSHAINSIKTIAIEKQSVLIEGEAYEVA